MTHVLLTDGTLSWKSTRTPVLFSGFLPIAKFEFEIFRFIIQTCTSLFLQSFFCWQKQLFIFIKQNCFLSSQLKFVDIEISSSVHPPTMWTHTEGLSLVCGAGHIKMIFDQKLRHLCASPWTLILHLSPIMIKYSLTVQTV